MLKKERAEIQATLLKDQIAELERVLSKHAGETTHLLAMVFGMKRELESTAPAARTRRKLRPRAKKKVG